MSTYMYLGLSLAPNGRVALLLVRLSSLRQTLMYKIKLEFLIHFTRSLHLFDWLRLTELLLHWRKTRSSSEIQRLSTIISLSWRENLRNNKSLLHIPGDNISAFCDESNLISWLLHILPPPPQILFLLFDLLFLLPSSWTSAFLQP